MEESNLIPIGEEDEDETYPQDTGRNNQEEFDNDAEINEGLNDREPTHVDDREPTHVDDLEINQEQSLNQMNQPVIDEEAAPPNNDEEEIIVGEEEGKDNLNGPKFSKGFVVMRLSVYNFNSHRIKMSFKINSESEAPNFYVPLHKLRSD